MKRSAAIVLVFCLIFSLSACAEFDLHIGPKGNDENAQTEAIQKFEVEFDPDGGELVKGELIQQVEKGQSAAVPQVEREGYQFDGWDPEVKPVTKDITYTAKWSLKKYDAKELYEIASPCVAEIIVYDEYDDPFASGSGFFIDSSGRMITNFHVMEGAYSATATTLDGTVYDVKYVIDYDSDIDIALIKIDVSGNEYLRMSDTPVVTGQKVYTIGSSLGLSGTLSDGIVSTNSREIEGVEYIQITAPISHGNSGGPLLDEYAQVLGINTLVSTEGQNINFSLPIKDVENLSTTGKILMEDFGAATSSTPVSYDLENGGFFPGVDEEYWEFEYNDSISLADEMTPTEVYAAVIEDEDDLDVFKLSVEKDCSINVYYVPYTDDDLYNVTFAVFDEDIEYVAEYDDFDISENDGLTLMKCTVNVKAGDYYLAVTGDDAELHYYAVGWEVADQ